MRLFGKTIGEYLRFAGGVVALVVVVGVARLALSFAGAPVSATKFVSVTTMSLLGVVYLAVRTHTSGFGSYRQLLPLMVITLGAGSWVSGFAVVLAIITGTDNIYSIPEYSGGGEGKTFFHAFAHVFIAPLVAGLIALKSWRVSGGSVSRATPRAMFARPATRFAPARGHGAHSTDDRRHRAGRHAPDDDPDQRSPTRDRRSRRPSARMVAR